MEQTDFKREKASTGKRTKHGQVNITAMRLWSQIDSDADDAVGLLDMMQKYPERGVAIEWIWKALQHGARQVLAKSGEQRNDMDRKIQIEGVTRVSQYV